MDDQGSASESSGSESAELDEGLSGDNSDEEGVVDKPGLAASVGERSRERGSEQGK